MMRKIRLATVFSGIGAIEQAFEKNNFNYSIEFACDNGERTLELTCDEIFYNYKNKNPKNLDLQKYIKDIYNQTKKTNWMKISYFQNYRIKEDQWFEDIRFIDGTKFKDKVDIFVGGSPCQSFSNMGKRMGLEDTRGTLFFDFARLVRDIEPKVFIYENVPGMITHDGGQTWKAIKEVFDELGYKLHYKLLNSKDYGIPQSRIRLYVVGFKNNKVNFNFPNQIKLEKTMFDFLEDKVDKKFYLGKKGFEFVTKNPSRAKINEPIIRTQKANQQFNWNGNFLFEEFDKISNRKDILSRAFVGTYNNKKGVARQLTPRECLRLMGFSDNFKIAVPTAQMYRQSGNSIVVNVLEEIVKEICKTGVFNDA